MPFSIVFTLHQVRKLKCKRNFLPLLCASIQRNNTSSRPAKLLHSAKTLHQIFKKLLTVMEWKQFNECYVYQLIHHCFIQKVESIKRRTKATNRGGSWQKAIFFFLIGMAQVKKEHYFMTLILTKDKTLSYFVYGAVKIAILCFALHSALSLSLDCVSRRERP